MLQICTWLLQDWITANKNETFLFGFYNYVKLQIKMKYLDFILNKFTKHVSKDIVKTQTE
jgi:hypothetical protein